jgi:hypothetical protein
MACPLCSGDREPRDGEPPPGHDRSCAWRGADPPPRHPVAPPASAAEVLGEWRHGLRLEDRARQAAREERRQEFGRQFAARFSGA